MFPVSTVSVIAIAVDTNVCMGLALMWVLCLWKQLYGKSVAATVYDEKSFDMNVYDDERSCCIIY